MIAMTNSYQRPKFGTKEYYKGHLDDILSELSDIDSNPDLFIEALQESLDELINYHVKAVQKYVSVLEATVDHIEKIVDHIDKNVDQIEVIREELEEAQPKKVMCEVGM